MIAQVYSAFNRRNIDEALSLMNGTSTGLRHRKVVGKEKIRAYWIRQWAEFDRNVEPIEVTDRDASRADVKVHQVVKDLKGNVLSDQVVLHVFSIANGLIERMDIYESKAAFRHVSAE